MKLILKWSAKCFLVASTAANEVSKFRITYTKLYVPIVILSTQEKVNLLEQLGPGFKRTISWNKYQSKITNQAQKQYLDFLIDQGVFCFII